MISYVHKALYLIIPLYWFSALCRKVVPPLEVTSDTPELYRVRKTRGCSQI